MSELREECYKCLNNQKCIGGAEYESLYCMINRKFKMTREEDSVYAHKFAIMQKQIDEKEARIKELEEKKKNSADFQQKYIEVTNLYLNSIPKQKVKDEIEALRKMLKVTMEGKLQEYTPKEIIIKINTLEELMEDK